jgi:hypothetical protein
MYLGIGWLNNSCQTISGCGWVVDDVDYTNAFFSSMDECISASTLSLDQLYPNNFLLYQNYPNPFNPFTKISYQIPFDALVNITIYDMNGRSIRGLVDEQQSAGFRSVFWNAKDDNNIPVSAGIYLYKVQAGNYIQTRKMVFLK